MPMYAETHTYDNNKTIQGMHQINSKDLLKIYANYNRDKDIESNIADSISSGDFNGFINNINNIEIVRRFDPTYAAGAKEKLADEINKSGSDYIDMTGYSAAEKSEIPEEDIDFNESPSVSADKAIKKEIKERFIGMLKNILYFNICLDESCQDLEEFIDLLDNDEEIREKAKIFDLDVDNLRELYNNLNN